MNHFPTTALLTLLLTSSLLGHDFWIRPSLFLVEPDTLVTVRLLVGDHLKGSPLRRDPSHIRHFVVHGPGGRQEIPGRDGTDPAGLLRPQEKGSYVIGYRSQRRRSVLPAEMFKSYLEEEGLTHVLELRARRGQTDAEGVEAFSRCAKALLVGGEAGPYLEDRLLGFELELLAEKHPARLGPVPILPVRILYQGLPLAHHPVRAMWEENPGVSLDVRTDEDGRALFELPRAGVWMVRAVHMVEAEESLDFDWESFWASLTFEIPEPVSTVKEIAPRH